MPTLPRAPLSIGQLNYIFQRSPANRVAKELQDSLRQPISRTRRPSTPPLTATRAVPKPKPYGYVPNSQVHRRPMGRPLLTSMQTADRANCDSSTTFCHTQVPATSMLSPGTAACGTPNTPPHLLLLEKKNKGSEGSGTTA